MTSIKRCIVIGTSAGGVDALKQILPLFKKPADFSVLVVLHLPASGPNLIPSLFAEDCHFHIKEADSGEPCEAETIYVAPPDYHLSLEPDLTLSLSNEPHVNFSRPAIDILFESAAYAMKKNVLGILMTGANNDGAAGLYNIHAQGGKTMIQDPKSAEYPAMPQSSLELFTPDKIVSLSQMADILARFQKENVL